MFSSISIVTAPSALYPSTVSMLQNWYFWVYSSSVVLKYEVLILFGGRKIPELMKGLGSGIKEFKNARKEDTSDSLADKTSHIDDNKS